jgi:hypothetical protein
MQLHNLRGVTAVTRVSACKVIAGEDCCLRGLAGKLRLQLCNLQ